MAGQPTRNRDRMAAWLDSLPPTATGQSARLDSRLPPVAAGQLRRHHPFNRIIQPNHPSSEATDAVVIALIFES